MTEDQKREIKEACDSANMAMAQFLIAIDRGASLADLYDLAAPVHTEALGVWSTIVRLLREEKGLDRPDRGTDEINLEELFS